MGMNTLTLSPLEAITPSPKVSSDYRFISTKEMVSRIQATGWEPKSIQIRRTRNAERKPFAFHRITFHNDAMGAPSHVGGAAPRIILQTSHEGNASFHLMMGFYVLVCSNGLVIGSTFDGIRVPHIGENPEQKVRNGITRILDEFPALFNTMNRMEQRELISEDQFSFARKAFPLRWDDREPTTEDLRTLLHPRRYYPNMNLWNLYNTIQENLTKGGFRIGNSSRRSRKITNILRDTSMNRQLWDIAESYLN